MLDLFKRFKHFIFLTFSKKEEIPEKALEKMQHHRKKLLNMKLANEEAAIKSHKLFNRKAEDYSKSFRNKKENQWIPNESEDYYNFRMEVIYQEWFQETLFREICDGNLPYFTHSSKGQQGIPNQLIVLSKIIAYADPTLPMKKRVKIVNEFNLVRDDIIDQYFRDTPETPDSNMVLRKLFKDMSGERRILVMPPRWKR